MLIVWGWADKDGCAHNAGQVSSRTRQPEPSAGRSSHDGL